MNIKTLYEFSIPVEKEVEKVEIKNEGGVETTVKTKVKEPSQVYFAFKKPSRNERESAEEYRIQVWGKLVQGGAMPYGILLKQYSNYGGLLSEEEKAQYVDFLATLEKKRKEFDLETDETIKTSLKVEMHKLSEKILDFENSQSQFFANSAETRSRNKTIEWLTLNLTYFRHDQTKNWELFFKGDTLDKKYDYLEKLQEESDELYAKTRDKIMFVAALYIALGNSLKSEDIAAFEELENK